MENENKSLQTKLDELRDALESSLTKSQKAEIQSQLKAVSDEIKEMKANAGKPDQATTDLIKSLQDQVKELKDAADKNQPVIDAAVINKDKKPASSEPWTFEKAIGEALLENEDKIKKFERKEIKNFSIDLKTVGDMTIANVTGGSRYGQQFAPSIIQRPYRKTHVRDLLTISPAGPGNSFTFMKENGAGEGAIAPTAETSTKPQIDKDLIEATVNFEVIAGWLRISRKMLNNVPNMVAFLQQRLPEDLLRIEDQQLLYGTGVTPEIKGIGTAGNFTAATSGSTQIEIALIDALALLEDVNERYATGIVIRPSTYYNFFKNVAAGGSEEFDLPRNYIFDRDNQILRISGVPVIPTTAVTRGDYFVGDFQQGAQIMMQEAMRLEFFEQDGTNVRENKITVRIEEILAFPVYGSDYFIKGSDATDS